MLGGSYHTFGIGIFYNRFYKEIIENEITKQSESEEKQEKNYKAGWNISLYHETSDQDFKFVNHNGTIYFNKIDDYNDIRRNSQYKKNTGMISGFYKFSDTKIKFLNDSFYRKHGIPGTVTRKTERTKRKHLRNTTGILTDTKNFLSDFTNLKTRFYYTYIQNDFKDPENELAFGANSNKAFLHNKGFHIMPEIVLNDFYQKLKFLMGYEEERFTEDKYTSYGNKTEEIPEKKRFHKSFHFANEIYLYKTWIRLQPEFRYEEYFNNFFIETQRKKIVLFDSFKNDETRLSFRNDSYLLTIYFIHNKKQKLKTSLRYSSEKRIPSFIELFGEKGSIIPNLNLRPEQSYNQEAGISYFYKNLLIIDTRFYSRNVRDLIIFVPNSQFSLRAENVEKAEFKGFEGSLKTLLYNWIQISIGYHYQEAYRIERDQFYRKKFTYLPLLPLHTFKGMLTLNPEGKIEFSLEVQYQGALFSTNSNNYFSYKDPKWFWNSSVYFKPSESIMLYLEIRNIQNQLYEDIIGYPLPGRNFKIGFKYFF